MNHMCATGNIDWHLFQFIY